MVCATTSLEMMGVLAPVAVMRMSASASAALSDSHGMAVPPIDSASAAACAGVRLMMMSRSMPCDLHVQGGELSHLAGAEHQHGSALQRAEDLLRERDRCVADRHRALGQRRLRAYALARRERRVKQLVEQRAGGAELRGDVVRLFHLAEHLRLAHDERVQAGGHAEQVTDRVLSRLRVQVRRQLFDGTP